MTGVAVVLKLIFDFLAENNLQSLIETGVAMVLTIKILLKNPKFPYYTLPSLKTDGNPSKTPKNI